jgi:hypothetical protein
MFRIPKAAMGLILLIVAVRCGTSTANAAQTHLVCGEESIYASSRSVEDLSTSDEAEGEGCGEVAWMSVRV